MNRNGFTLVEVLIAVAIATVLIAGAMTAHVSNLSFYKTSEGRVNLSQDGILLIDYLRNELMPAGGGSIRSWMGIWVEDNCAARAPLPPCNNSDRLTISTVTVPVQECPIIGQISANEIQVARSGVAGACCLQPQAATAESSYENHQIMLVLGDFYSQRFATNVTIDAVNCRLTYSAGQAALNDRPPPLLPGPIPYNWSNGTVTLVNVETFYLDTTTRLLKRWMNTNNDTTLDATEDVIVADRVFDMQFALGYDFNPADGNVVSSANGTGDEWLYNAAPPLVQDAMNAGVFVGPNWTRSSLLMVEAALIVGSDEAEGGTPSGPRNILNGPPRSLTGWMMMEEAARFAPRNAYVFQ